LAPFFEGWGAGGGGTPGRLAAGGAPFCPALAGSGWPFVGTGGFGAERLGSCAPLLGGLGGEGGAFPADALLDRGGGGAFFEGGGAGAFFEGGGAGAFFEGGGGAGFGWGLPAPLPGFLAGFAAGLGFGLVAGAFAGGAFLTGFPDAFLTGFALPLAAERAPLAVVFAIFGSRGPRQLAKRDGRRA
jgi:hypothetical protein